jgi:hypothetical protein
MKQLYIYINTCLFYTASNRYCMKKRNRSILLLSWVLNIIAFGITQAHAGSIPPIVTNPISPLAYNAGASLTVSYSIYSSFNSGNVFSAQLSDATGSFNNPVTIGSVSTTTAGSITANISPLTAPGSLYRIRVVSSAPATNGSDNGADISIKNLNTGLLAYYPFNGNSADGSGNGRNGTISGGVTLTTDRNGNTNSAYSFNGSDGYINCGTPFLNNLSQITISGWIKPISISTNHSLFGQNDLHEFSLASGPKAYYWNYGSGGLSTSYTPALNTWVHIAIVAGNSTVKMYFNGALAYTANAPISVATSGSNVKIGGYTGDDVAGQFFNGALDDICFYNRALNAAEISDLMNGFVPNSITTAAITPAIYFNGNPVNVAFTALGNYVSGNIFTAELSDEFGSFTNPLAIGTLAATTSGTISATIPVNAITGTKYRIRVVASNPIVTGADNGSNLTIAQPLPVDPLPATNAACDSVLLNAGSANYLYSWNTGSTTPSITAKVNGWYKVVISNGVSTVTDSTLVSIARANILNTNTTFCKTQATPAYKLAVDSSAVGTNITKLSQLSANLQNGLIAYYTLNGDGKDLVNGGTANGTATNTTAGANRFGFTNNAQSFLKASQSRIVTQKLASVSNNFSYSVYVNPAITTPLPPAQTIGFSGFFGTQCVIHPTHGANFGNKDQNAGSGLYVGTNGLYISEHSDGYVASPLVYTGDLTGWHLITIVYDNKTPKLYIDGLYVKSGLVNTRTIWPSLGYDPTNFANYNQSGFGAGFTPGGSP